MRYGDLVVEEVGCTGLVGRNTLVAYFCARRMDSNIRSSICSIGNHSRGN